ncbi:hypothetical protein [Brucella sp. IR073]|uniref:hypothetical protein n=1 Tax=unclassified Brucella TaxID=2632610 RepID=UPI003B97E40F
MGVDVSISTAGQHAALAAHRIRYRHALQPVKMEEKMISTKFNAQMAESVTGRRMQIEAGSARCDAYTASGCITYGRCIPHQIDGTNATASGADQ